MFFFPMVLVGLLLAGSAGTWTRRRFPGVVMEESAGPFTSVQAAVLSLLGLLLVVLPVVVAASLTLIWDLHNPQTGPIRVRQDSMRRTLGTVEEAVR